MQPGLQAAFLFVLAALALAAWCPPALAASLAVGDLRLAYGPPWQRAGAEEEAQAESLILRQPDAAEALTVMLPRHQPRLRMPQARFYQQLETVWRTQYGETARFGWLEAGGLRWRMVRRPSLDRADAVVFHLVTVIDGRAHHLLAYAPPSAAELPEAVVHLLDGPVSADEIRAMPAPPPAPTPGWRLDRVLRIQPRSSGLDQVMTLERHALRVDGGITGLAMEAKDHSLKASLQGFVWVPGPKRREVRREFSHRWEIDWSAPPRVWPDGEAAPIVVSAGTGSDRLGLVIRLRYLCGAADRLRALLNDTERGEDDASAGLQAGFAACRGRAARFMQAEATVDAGETSRPILLQPPDTAALSADEQGLLVLTVQPIVGEGRPGRALLHATAIHYVYARTP